MIQPDRLKELIEEKATIYVAQGNMVLDYQLNEDTYNRNNYYEVDNDCLCLMKILNNEEDDCEYAWLLTELFETKENYIETCRLAEKLFLGEKV